MHLLGFGISFAFLTVACILGIVSLATNSWWKDEEDKFEAGVWQQCYENTPCVDFGTVFDRSMMKLLNATFDRTRDTLESEEYHLNAVRGMAVFHLITLGVATFFVGVFIYSIKSHTSKNIAIWLQCVVATIIVISAFIGLASSVHATDYKKIFGSQVKLKQGGSWVLFLLCTLLSLITGCIFVATICYDRYSSRLSKETAHNATEGVRNKSGIASKASSRKHSEDVQIVSNTTAPHYQSYAQYNSKRGEGGEGGKNDVTSLDDIIIDENDNDFKIPELNEVLSNCQHLDVNNDDVILGGKMSYTDSDYTLAQLSDYSSQHITELNSDMSLANSNRSASFSNQLYDDESN